MSDSSSTDDTSSETMNNMALNSGSFIDYQDFDPDTFMTLAGFNECFNSLHPEHVISAADGYENVDDNSDAVEFSETAGEASTENNATPTFRPFTLTVENAEPVLSRGDFLQEDDPEDRIATIFPRQKIAPMRRLIKSNERAQPNGDKLAMAQEVKKLENFKLPELMEEELRRQEENKGVKPDDDSKAEFATDLMFQTFKEFDSYFN